MYENAELTIQNSRKRVLTQAECILWFEFLSQYPLHFQMVQMVNGIEVDFYCKDAQLAILVKDEQEQAEMLENCGVETLCFSSTDILNHFPKVCAMIQCRIKGRMLLLGTKHPM